MTIQDLPTGTVTFLFTDIEGSTQLWEQAPDQAMQALVRHDEIIQTLLSRTTWELVHRLLPANVQLRDEGEHRLRIFPAPNMYISCSSLTYPSSSLR